MEEKGFGSCRVELSRLLRSSAIRLPTLFYNIQHFLLNEMLLNNDGCDCVTEKVFVFYQIHFFVPIILQNLACIVDNVIVAVAVSVVVAVTFAVAIAIAPW